MCRTCERIVVIDYEGYGISNAPSGAVAIELVRILRNCYPERLHKAVLVAPTPGLLWWKVLKVLVYPTKSDKMKFAQRCNLLEDKAIRENVLDMRNIPREYGDKLEWSWNFEARNCTILFES